MLKNSISFLLFLCPKYGDHYKGDKVDGEKYFELSEYLGKKLELFEGCLSARSGLQIILKEEAEKDIKNGDYQQALEKINKVIEKYKELRDSSIECKEGYKPGTEEGYEKYNLVVPAQDAYNKAECDEQLAKCLSIKFDALPKGEYSGYVQEIADQFVGKDESSALLKMLVNPRKDASIKNTLGQILIKLYDRGVDIGELKAKLSECLKLTEEDDLNFIKQIFTLAEAKTTGNDFTKADANDGLVMVYQRLGEVEEASKHKIARDEINKALKRDVKYESDTYKIDASESDVKLGSIDTVQLTKDLPVNLEESTKVDLLGGEPDHSDIG
ncbi:hypothetical protein [Candidatus Tisiphia endosymbiont of Oplodontha viridula]|uniref:hypothetical protein n=1 Tax=Candidatus Tisiphia endosymbiont of Oplodontha viridula TaxID=3077925 RepID=UPI0035C89F49